MLVAAASHVYAGPVSEIRRLTSDPSASVRDAEHRPEVRVKGAGHGRGEYQDNPNGQQRREISLQFKPPGSAWALSVLVLLSI